MVEAGAGLDFAPSLMAHAGPAVCCQRDCRAQLSYQHRAGSERLLDELGFCVGVDHRRGRVAVWCRQTQTSPSTPYQPHPDCLAFLL